MIQSLFSFLSYLGTAVALLAVFIWLYEKFTPYHEFQLMKQNNSAAAVTLSGAMLGFTLPMVSSIYYTQSLAEMTLWSLVTGIVQFVFFVAMHRWAKHIENGQVAPAIFVASGSVAVGLLNAVSISH